MDDIIYRQDALSELHDWREACVESGHRESASDLKDVIRAFEELPSAQPERKKGTWIIVIDDFYGSTEANCSECGFEMLVNEPGNGLHDVSDLHYCPNCGADMRGDKHG